MTTSGIWFVGIGASAGGVEALRQLVPSLPGGDVAYVVAQHMSPSHPSMLTQVLARETSLPVVEIRDGDLPQVGMVHVAPPNCDVRVVDGRFRAAPGEARISPQPSIDALLSSLAAEVPDRTIGVVLSGTGSDGTKGLLAVAAAGGVTIVQDPATTQYPDMPESVIRAGAASLVLDPSGIAWAIAAAVGGTLPGDLDGADTGHRELARLLERQTGLDLSGYRNGTITRQVDRRMRAAGEESLDQYVQRVRADPGELTALRDALLINVTGFWRDPGAFDALQTAADGVIAAKSDGEQLRAWVAGCATGEEAYSVAMLLVERARAAHRDLSVKVFATDLSDNAMDVARRGQYPAPAADALPPEWVDRYLERRGDQVVVSRRLRDLLVVARQDVTRDPPLMRMDVVSCRNLLIYLRPETQQRVLAQLHTALLPGGLLFLGKSESAPVEDGMFVAVDAAHRVYRRLPGPGRGRPVPLPSRAPGAVTVLPRVTPRDLVRDAVRDQLLDVLDVTAVVVDEAGTPVHQVGDLSPYLTLPSAGRDFTLADMVPKAVRTEISALVVTARRGLSQITSHSVVMPGREGAAVPVRLNASRLVVPGVADPYVVLTFRREDAVVDGVATSAEVSADGATSGALARRLALVEQELSATREHLQAVVEELEASNEELQAANEELQAAAEELQATNEELETTNEELQVSNGELASVNTALELRGAELTEANAVLNGIQDSVHVAVLLLDRDLQVQRFTPNAVRLLGLAPSNLGKPLPRLPFRLDTVDFDALVREVLDSGQGESIEAWGIDTTYLLQVMPYEPDGVTLGAVVAVSDITDLAATRAELSGRLEEFQVLAEALPHLVYRSDPALRVMEYVSTGAQSVLAVPAASLVGRAEALMDRVHPDDVGALGMGRAALGEGAVQIDVRALVGGQERTLRDTSRLVRRADGSLERLGAIVDITDLHAATLAAESALAEAAAVFDRGGTPMLRVRVDGTIAAANPLFTDLLGRDLESVRGRPLASLFIAEDRDRLGVVLADVAADGATAWWRGRLRCADAERLVDLTLAAIGGAAPAAPTLLVSLRDVTEEEANRRARLAQETQWAAVFTGSGAAMAILGPDGRFLRVNDALVDSLGRSAAELETLRVTDVTHPEDVGLELMQLGDLLSGRVGRTT